MGRRTRAALLVAVVLVSATALWLTPRIPLGAGYHDFADRRPLLGIPNCLDVLSNIPFLVAGIWGMGWLARRSSAASFVAPSERLPYFLFFAGVALTGIGSFWYHLAPGNSRLPWDLLPMTVCFVSMVVATIVERISLRAGLLIYLPLLALGAASVAYWYFTEMQGRGDYRFYLFVQFFSPVILILAIALFPPRYTGTESLAFAFALFVAAKFMETFDRQIYDFTGLVSGHALKHITAGVACYWVLRMLQRRHALRQPSEHRFAECPAEFAAECDRQPN